MLSKNEIDVALQNNRNVYTKIQLLDFNLQILDEISGVVTELPSFSNDSTSDIRRTLNISLTPTDSSFEISEGNKIWIDKFVKVEIGIEDIHTQEIIYTKMGVYIINNPSRTYSSVDNLLTLECVDLMAKLTGLRNGTVSELEYVIPTGSNVRLAIIKLLELSGFNQYIVEDCPVDTYSEISVPYNGTVYDMLKALSEVNPNYQIYFDVDGVFHYEKIPNGVGSFVMLDNSVFDNIAISYTVDTNFSDLKNDITVYGYTNDVGSNYAPLENVSIIDNVINLKIEGIDSYFDTMTDGTKIGIKVGFSINKKVLNANLNINGLGKKELKTNDGEFAIFDDTTEEVYYIARYNVDGDYFEFYGHLTPTYTIAETNPNSPFCVDKIDHIKLSIQDDSLYTDDLVKQKAEYELYNRCRILNSITLNCVPIYGIDTNWLVSIKLPYEKDNKNYIIKSINTSGGINGTQSISMMEFYKDYPIN